MSDNDTDRDEQIRERAYALWIEEGCPEGRADEHWHRAAEALDEEAAAVTPLTTLGGDAAAVLPPVR